MKIKYNVEKLETILNNLYLLTGINFSFLDNNYQHVCKTAEGYNFCLAMKKENGISYSKNCYNCDRLLLQKSKETKKFVHHICHAGLFDAVMPIIKDDIIAGTVLMGRIRTFDSPKAPIYKSNSELYYKLPLFSDRQIESLKSLLPNILFESAIFIEKDCLYEKITEYIINNLTGKLSINNICSEFYISKNTLYKIFKNQFNCTVNEYITKIRIEKAQKFLLETSMPLYSVSEAVGISNYTYFCKLFKKNTGFSPSDFKKKNQTIQ